MRRTAAGQAGSYAEQFCRNNGIAFETVSTPAEELVYEIMEAAARLEQAFEITRLAAIRALSTLMNMDTTYDCINCTDPEMYLAELRTLTTGF